MVMKIKQNIKSSFLGLAAILLASGLTSVPDVHAFPKGMLFPVLGGGGFSNDFNAHRSLNGVHRATDIFASKHTPVVAAVDGVVEWINYPQPSWGWSLSIRDPEGYSYWYIHLNNDNRGTDDGAGSPMLAYAPDLPEGATVKKGQLLGYVGDSGNAENTPPHLHFEILNNNAGGERINPYPYLLEANIASQPNRDYPPVGDGEILPYGPLINSHVNVSQGIFTEGKRGIVVGTGPGYAPHVRVLDTVSITEIAGFYAYNPAQYTAGVDVAAGDVDGDGVDEIITGTMIGAPHVRVLRLDGTEIGGFYAYASTSTGGVNVAAADIDNDGKDEIVTVPAINSVAQVKAFSSVGTQKLSFNAYTPDFKGGADVAAGDLVGDGKVEIATVAGPGGSAHVKLFDNTGLSLGSGFSAYEAYTGYTGGARISVGNVVVGNLVGSSDKNEILVAPRLNGGPHVRLLEADGTPVSEGYYYEEWWAGNYDVAAGTGSSYVSSGTSRRSSIRLGPM